MTYIINILKKQKLKKEQSYVNSLKREFLQPGKHEDDDEKDGED